MPTLTATKNGTAYTASEDKPTEQAEADGVENKSKGNHGGGSMHRGNGRAFHHHRGAILDVKSKLGGVAALATPPGFGR